MIAIVDYGAGNLQSVQKALHYIGASACVTAECAVIEAAQGVILPGVGSFAGAMNCMKQSGLFDVVKWAASGEKPFLGICLGLQLLFAGSEESPGVPGLGILEGTIQKIPGNLGYKVPHIGWNSLDITQPEGLFAGVEPDAYVYFVHSYYLKAAHTEQVAARTQYGVAIDSALQAGHLCATQFHPEKSGRAGLQMLRNFVRMTQEEC